MKTKVINVWLFTIIGLIFSTFVTFSAEELSTVVFKIDTKSKEAKVKIETVVNMLKGVTDAEFDLNAKRLEVKFDQNQIDENMIRFAIESMGYSAIIEKQSLKEVKENPKQDSTKK